MLLYYVRHGDPIYNPDSLTPLGERQAEAVGHRLSQAGLDRVFSSPSRRAILTAKPTCEMLHLTPTEVAFAGENVAAKYFFSYLDQKRWIFQDPEIIPLFHSTEVLSLGHEWYRYPAFAEHPRFSEGVAYYYDQVDAFFAELGYEHERYTGRYRAVRSNQEHVALFAHAGFGVAFLSTLLDIPYPVVSSHFDMCHSGITVIHFDELDGYSYPKLLMLSSDGHLYRDGLPLYYNNELRI